MSSHEPPKKRCLDCRELKDLDAFPRTPRRKDGHGAYCKLCYSVRYRQYRERKATKEGRVIHERRIVPTGMRFCPTCKQVKMLEEFPRNRSGPSGRGGYCKPCHNARGKEHLDRRGGSREYHLRRRYGIGAADVDAMIEAQGGQCATCNGKPEHVDHDHTTGKVRGVLCFNCNQALGNIRDNRTTLRRLDHYLRRHGPAVDAEFASQLEASLAEYLHGPAA